MPPPTAPIDLGPSCDALAAVVRAVHDDQLTGPTPSPGYSVGALLDHVDGLSTGLVTTARKLPPPADDQPRDGDAARLRPGWRDRIPTQLDELAAAWREAGAWDGETQAGGVPLEAATAGAFALDELVVHGWELSRSCGVPYVPDPAAVAVCIALLRDAPRSADLFADPVAVPDGSPPLDVLVGLSGRDPSWRPVGPGARGRSPLR